MIENNQKNPEIFKKKRGRPENVNKSISVHVRIPYDLYQKIEAARQKQEKNTGRKVTISALLREFAKTNTING